MAERRPLTVQESKRFVRKSIRRDSRPVSKVEALCLVKRAMDTNGIDVQSLIDLWKWEAKLKALILEDRIARRELAK